MINLNFVKQKINGAEIPYWCYEKKSWKIFFFPYRQQNFLGKKCADDKKKRLIKGGQMTKTFKSEIFGSQKKICCGSNFAPRKKTAELSKNRGDKKGCHKIIDDIEKFNFFCSEENQKRSQNT